MVDGAGALDSVQGTTTVAVISTVVTGTLLGTPPAALTVEAAVTIAGLPET